MNAGNRIILLLLWSALLFTCSFIPFTGGSGEETTNGYVMGTMVTQNGVPAARATAQLFPASYDPVKDTTTPLQTATDALGSYSFSNVPSGNYTILAVHNGSGTRTLISGIHVAGDTCIAPVDTLREPGSIQVTLPAGVNSANGYIFAPGTPFSIFLNHSTSSVVLDSVPTGTVPAVYYASTKNTGSTIIRFDVVVQSHDTTVIWNPQWHFAHAFVLNTSVTGADISSSVENFPVLVRLTSSNFNFSQAQFSGGDILFTKSDNTFLPYEIERWDPVTGLAEVWVKVDTVHGGNSAQLLMMYWGNVNAASQSNPAAVFETAAGFAGVWHLSQPAGAVVMDATANGISGTATATTTAAGAVGTGQLFDGTSSVIRVSGSAASTLNFPENGTYSVSAWIYADTLDTLYYGIVYKSNFQYGLQIRPERNWEFFSFIDGTGWEGSRSPASAGSWHFLAGVRRGAQQYLYVNGVCVDSSVTLMSSNQSRIYDSPLEIGHCPDGGLEPDRWFGGVIDEVRVSSVSSSADWIKLCYMNQKAQDALVKW
ncbi:MAG: DUF2341 domain-containing protein [Chitinispirillaceae bacterium]|nr:DUF2341 domain-containing protein [Chitinispirillaceae bacterium]